MWLEGKHEASADVLVKFEENPSYQCPVRNEDLEELKFPTEPNINAEDLNFKRSMALSSTRGFDG